ncbi:hypothetical protein CRG98_008151 [Punica granatum]|uniref:Uncharacterized protein n=1 Tax=Punica granatum TaxID=22663 RepID=A0A2I0KSM1_PUNGR|nr:hypothetical protein CRG98_008151 [Punica granatum]
MLSTSLPSASSRTTSMTFWAPTSSPGTSPRPLLHLPWPHPLLLCCLYLGCCVVAIPVWLLLELFEPLPLLVGLPPSLLSTCAAAASLLLPLQWQNTETGTLIASDPTPSFL